MKRLHERSFQKRIGISPAAFNFLRSKLQLWPAGLLAILFSIPFAVLALSDIYQPKPAANSQPSTPDWSQQSSAEVRVDNSQPADPSGDISSESSTNMTNNSDANVEVNVNGEQIELPDNGSVHKVITDENGSTQTVIDIKSSESSTSTSTHQSLRSEIKSTGGGSTSITVESSGR